MESRERVIEIVNHRPADRMPFFGWVFLNMEKQISERFGSVAAFEDHYGFDLAHLFGGPAPFNYDQMTKLRQENGGEIEPDQFLDMPYLDPDDMGMYDGLKKQIEHHKENRGRFVYVQTPGIFEGLNKAFGIENHLAYLLMYEDQIKACYRRQAEWIIKFANNCLDLGVDMIHLSDDWGSQAHLLFNPDTWTGLIYPPLKKISRAVKTRGAYLSLHSDGNVSQVVDGIADIGFDVVHPWQESAHMSHDLFKCNYMDKFTIMGGLDIQTTLGFGKIDFLKSEIERVISTFRHGGMIFCTSHFVQDHCTIDELVTAYDLVYELTRK